MDNFSSLADLFTGAFANEWAPYALMAGGTYMNAEATRRQIEERNRRAAEEAARQQAISQARAAQFSQQVQGFEMPAQEKARADQAAKLEARFAASPSVTEAEYADSNPNSSTEVKTTLARRVAEAVKKGTDYSKAAAVLGSYGQQGQDNAIALGRGREVQAELGRQSAASSAAFPYELDAAKSAGSGFRLGADLANGIGNLSAVSQMFKKKRAAPAVDPSKVAWELP